MDSRNNTRAKMIVWLRDAIEHEISKPDDEIDYELVDELTKLLSELMGDQVCLTDDEAKQRLAQIVERKPKEVKRKPRVKLKRLVMIACAAMVMLSATVTISSFDRYEKSNMLAIFRLDDGDTFADTGVTYIKMNNPTTYSSIEELIEKEELDIKYPKILPEGVKIEKVLYNDTNIIVVFNDDSLKMEVCSISYMSMDNVVGDFYTININSVDSYITKINNEYFSYTNIDDFVYVITSESVEIIETILSGILGD